MNRPQSQNDQASGLIGHYYRGELSRTNLWRQRLDATTNWAVVLTATLLTWTFGSGDNPHYVLLVGALGIGSFLWIEARRYRYYDAWRYRVRLLEEHLFAEILHPVEQPRHEPEADDPPSRGGEPDDRRWRRLLSEDLRAPAVKIPFAEALARRLKRVHLWILTVLALAWYLRVAVFPPKGATVVEAASVGPIPGLPVLVLVGAVLAALYGVAFWPRERRAKGEQREDTDRDRRDH